ncbi:protein imuA [Caulobacter sp. BK020]|uniref:ImuA family protein n=1 Tax=Caulobacter sp. BK020 TaxID=2512117 RepID=UPI0010E20F70|nr:protein imuA [Caulobacter sp. BK020]TCS10186.1 protein ImuA [Caulobacter sp. BK020]
MAGAKPALSALRAQIAALEAGTRTPPSVLPFGDPRIDGCFPAGGLPRGGWHEVGGAGLEEETSAAPAAFSALMLRPLAARGAVVWVMRRADLHAPGLAGLGFPTGRLIQVRARDEAEVLSVLEDALATVGVAAAIGEAESPDLKAGRRLQLACERRGATGVLLRRRPYGGAAGKIREVSGAAAQTRWRIAAAPSQPPPGLPGLGLPDLGPPRWRVELERCRGGRPGAWILEQAEAADGPHPFRLVSKLADHDVAAEAAPAPSVGFADSSPRGGAAPSVGFADSSPRGGAANAA